jgi:D-alanyl-D-alanine carboxypeptidase
LYASGNAYWKFKGGSTYIVEDVDSMQNATAFVMAAFSENGIGYKEYPADVQTVDEWLADMADDEEDYQAFKKEVALVVSPKTGKAYSKGYA